MSNQKTQRIIQSTVLLLIVAIVAVSLWTPSSITQSITKHVSNAPSVSAPTGFATGEPGVCELCLLAGDELNSIVMNGDLWRVENEPALVEVSRDADRTCYAELLSFFNFDVEEDIETDVYIREDALVSGCPLFGGVLDGGTELELNLRQQIISVERPSILQGQSDACYSFFAAQVTNTTGNITYLDDVKIYSTICPS